jgi:hypothetical protein
MSAKIKDDWKELVHKSEAAAWDSSIYMGQKRKDELTSTMVLVTYIHFMVRQIK